MVDLDTCWDNILKSVKQEISNVSFNTWFTDLKPLSFENGVLTILADSTVTKNAIEKTHLKIIVTAANIELGRSDASVKIVTEMPNTLNRYSSENDGRKTINEYTLKPDYVFDNFIVGSSNKMAHAAAVAVAENPGHSYNPLFLYGDSGLGKTHLMYAIAHYIADQNTNAKILYASSEKFTNDLVAAIRLSKTEEFKTKYREIDVLLIDDVQFLENKESTQEEFFHTFNELFNLDKQIVLSSDRHPDEIKTLTERLRSRFASGLIADVKAPDFETRTAIVEKKADNLGISIPQEVSQFIAQSVKSNIRDLEGALNRVIAYVNLTNRPLDLELARDALKDILTSKVTYQLNIDTIKNAVANHFGIKLEDIDGRKRTKDIAAARQAAMYICRELLDETFESIGDSFKRDYTTVISNTQVIADKMNENPAFNKEITELMEKIKQN